MHISLNITTYPFVFEWKSSSVSQAATWPLPRHSLNNYYEVTRDSVFEHMVELLVLEHFSNYERPFVSHLLVLRALSVLYYTSIDKSINHLVNNETYINFKKT